MRNILIFAMTVTLGFSSLAQSPDLTASAKEFVNLLAAEDFAAAVKQYDAAMASALPEPKLRQTWRELVKAAGPFQKQIRTRTDRQAGYDIVFVTCRFEKAVVDVKVVFNASKKVTGLFFVPGQVNSPAGPPPYADPKAFREQAVTVGEGQWALPGTLAMPVGKGPWPAVILVHGSGPQDRDQTIGGIKSFRDLAQGLASKGIAVLRYDKRTLARAAKMAGLKGSFTVKEEAIDDVQAAVDLLRRTEGIVPDRIYVLGHSLGAMLVPRIAQAQAGIAGFVVMAPPARPIEDLMVEQVEYFLGIDGELSPDDKAQMEKLKSEVARVKKLQSADASSNVPVLGAPAAYWLGLKDYRPAEAAKSVKAPMLVMHGERDYQVTAVDFAAWREALASRKDVVFRSYPKLNHLFVAGEGKGTPSEYDQPGNVAKEVVDDIAEWIKSGARARQP